MKDILRGSELAALVIFLVLWLGGSAYLASRAVPKFTQQYSHPTLGVIQVAMAASGDRYLLQPLNDEQKALALKQKPWLLAEVQTGQRSLADLRDEEIFLPVGKDFAQNFEALLARAAVISGLLALLFWVPLRLAWARSQDQLEFKRGIASSVLDEAMKQTKDQVAVPSGTEGRFVARFWDRMTELFRL